MPVLRFGRTSPTIQRVTFGALVVFCMKCVPWTHHSEPMTCQGLQRRLLQEFTHQFHLLIQMNCQPWWRTFYKLILHLDLLVHRYWICLVLRTTYQRLLRELTPSLKRIKKVVYSILLSSQETWAKSLKDYPNLSTTQNNLNLSVTVVSLQDLEV